LFATGVCVREGLRPATFASAELVFYWGLWHHLMAIYAKANGTVQ
jgi:hypothetical protein